MKEEKTTDIKIVLMSPALMDLYEVHGFQKEADLQPITFYQPRECLEMLITDEQEQIPEDFDDDLFDKVHEFERKIGELELRLSFFTSIYRWQ